MMKTRKKHQLKKRPRPKFWQGAKLPLAVAHRGGDGAGFGKRNTMPAFKSAEKLGYTYMETDVIDTKDSQVIISHGAKTFIGARLRGTFTFKKLQNLTYQQIQQDLKVSGESIPLLTELLTELPDCKFIIDVKSDRVVKPLIKVLEDNQALDRVLVYSFNYRRVVRLQKLIGPKIELGLLIGRRLSFVNKLPRLRLGHFNHLEAISLNYWLGSKRRLKLIQNQGLKTIVWTPDTERSIRRALKNGADVVISDRVHLLKKLLMNSSKV